MGIDNELRESARIIYSRVLKCVVNNCSDDQKYYSKAFADSKDSGSESNTPETK